MPERKPPSRPREADVDPARDASDSTVLAPRPDMTDDTGDVDDGIVFEDSVSSSDVSLIEANESLPSLDAFDGPRTASYGDGVMLDDTAYHPATEVMRLAFSDDGNFAESAVTGPVEVKKWKVGAQEEVPSEDPESTPPAASPERAARGMFSLPPAEQGGTRVDVERGGKPAARPVSLDVDALKRNLEEAERLLHTMKQQLSGVDLENRGMNAQLAAALHRIGEALAMLRR